jgi:iron(III) transport system substrate-binding protein
MIRMRTTALRVLSYLCLSAFIGGQLVSCEEKPAQTVTLYTSVDQQVAKQIVDQFTKETGIQVDLKTDTEATKSVGLAERLRAEKANPIAHVFWGNEVFHTVNLAEEGLFAPLTGLPELNEIPDAFKDAQQRWAGNGLRARVLAVSENAGETKGSLDDLIDPRFKGKIAIARPLFGTTGGHVATLYALWGEAKADDFFRKLRDNGALLLGGNGPVADAVGNGTMLVGLTDNDDVFNAQRNRGELWQVLPDQDGVGTLAIPTTVALVQRSDTPEAARKLASYLLSDAVERKLLDANFCGYSVRTAGGQSLKTIPVKYAEAARLMATAPQRAAAILDDRAK